MSNKAGFGPQRLSSFKTQKGCGFLHHSQVLLLVYCQDFTMVVLVWPGLGSPRRTDLTLGRGVTDAGALHQHSASLSLPDSLSCITDSSVSMQNPRQCCKHSFLPLETTLLKGSRYSLWKLDPLQKHVEKTAVPWPDPALIWGSLCSIRHSAVYLALRG